MAFCQLSPGHTTQNRDVNREQVLLHRCIYKAWARKPGLRAEYLSTQLSGLRPKNGWLGSLYPGVDECPVTTRSSINASSCAVKL